MGWLDVEEVVRGSSEPPAKRASTIGESREGRPIVGYRFGRGRLGVSLIAGCHADEPVGPATLDRLAAHLARRPADDPLLETFALLLVPHVNPDGEARNRAWTETTRPVEDHAGEPAVGYELATYVENVRRELPGDDVEFGFPRDGGDLESRPENRSVAGAMTDLARDAEDLVLHASFHGMGLAVGPWFLLEPFWRGRTRELRRRLRDRVTGMGYRLNDPDRRGEKGFWRIEPGFATRPDSRAMRDHFLGESDPETAGLFRPSSMETARGLGDDPLTMVSEMPLFLLPEEGPFADPAMPRGERIERLGTAVAEHGEGAAAELGIRAMPVRDQARLQVALLAEGLEVAGPGADAR